MSLVVRVRYHMHKENDQVLVTDLQHQVELLADLRRH